MRNVTAGSHLINCGRIRALPMRKHFGSGAFSAFFSLPSTFPFFATLPKNRHHPTQLIRIVMIICCENVTAFSPLFNP
jgi:hypothetical protein